MPGDIERRQADSLRIKKNRLVGYAAVFGSESRDLGGFTETIRPGAFARSLSEASADILALFGHSTTSVLGRVGAGTLRLEEDTRGLRYSIDLPDTQDGRDLKTLVERGDVAGASFGFRTIDDRWEFGPPRRRELIDVELIEVTVTAMPAYTDTSVARRHLEQHQSADHWRDQPQWRREQEERSRLLSILALG